MRQEPRWKHRFESFERAFRLLTEGLEKDELNDLETAGLTRMFGVTFELAWKTLNDRLEHDDINVVATPRQVICHAFGAGMIDDVQTWLNMLEDRNKMSHECDLEDFRVLETNIRDSHWVMLERFRNQFATDSHAKSTMKAEKTLVIADATLAMMQDVFAQYPDLQKVTLFGSRAIGDATERSDIDLVTHGMQDGRAVARIGLDLEDLPIPQICEVQAYERIKVESLKRHIDRDGIVVYDRDTAKKNETARLGTETEPAF